MNRRFFVKKIFAVSAILPFSNVFAGNEFVSSACNNNESCTVNISDYGCRSYQENEQYFDNRKILQDIIDTCAMLSLKKKSRMIIYIPKGIYYLSSTTSNSTDNDIIGAFCLVMRSNLVIKGEGILKLLPNQYGKGAYFRILASNKKNKIENCDIIGVGFDGNSSFQTDGVQASNILLECKGNINISDVHSINANGNGILIKGSVDQNDPVINVNIYNCFVNNCKKIGIQVSQFNELNIYNNTISHCNDNGIDIYGDLGGYSPNITNGNDFSIFNNKVSFCLNGIFPETVSNGKVYNNTLLNMKESGIHVNRIHGLPKNIIIEGNLITFASSGFYFTGDMRDIVVRKNKLSKITDAFFSFGSGRGNASGVRVVNNELTFDGGTVLASFSGEKIRNVEVVHNIINSNKEHSTVLLNRNNANFIDDKSVTIK